MTKIYTNWCDDPNCTLCRTEKQRLEEDLNPLTPKELKKKCSNPKEYTTLKKSGISIF